MNCRDRIETPGGVARMSRSDRVWLAFLAVGLVVVSAALYAIHFAIFRDAHHIFLYMVGDLAFVPLEVLMVGLIIERLISVREKRRLAHKLNMVIGAFFSELGTPLLGELLPAMCQAPEIKAAAPRESLLEERGLRPGLRLCP